LGITVELEIMSQAADIIRHVLLFLAYGGTSVVETQNQTSFHMRWMVIVEVEISASVGGFPVDWCPVSSFPDDQNIQKGSLDIIFNL
jgi:hypothetical protein